jgi:hypothetical protein
MKTKTRASEIQGRVEHIQEMQKTLEHRRKEVKATITKYERLCKSMVKSLFPLRTEELVVNEHTITTLETGPFFLSYDCDENSATIKTANGGTYFSYNNILCMEQFIVSDCGTMVAHYIAPDYEEGEKVSHYTLFPMSEIVIVPNCDDLCPSSNS